jgi:hypothetical protein
MSLPSPIARVLLPQPGSPRHQAGQGPRRISLRSLQRRRRRGAELTGLLLGLRPTDPVSHPVRAVLRRAPPRPRHGPLCGAPVPVHGGPVHEPQALRLGEGGQLRGRQGDPQTGEEAGQGQGSGPGGARPGQVGRPEAGPRGLQHGRLPHLEQRPVPGRALSHGSDHYV